ncbi:phosphonate C-P lyase system protein PhnG [Burkholderia pseudomallei]|uniref:Phosphonate C-P lyase system protein PhnG n=1 Tax=Burkholderia pseudomallei TaxID=28450 RepID=A0AA40JEH5_BURPE|nr:phosphonate C-P lyase system protein PhnG [Burkholderia pseudomallei]AHE32032.1 phosphonate C-P lyase system protein PhnG [Burkholderia pseudomallei NAU20B-16]AHG33316.1 phosphonate C-P lyase system protein PhnG [Burkholderia pseudomallei MSHR511]AHG69118.1 phosphonate C-P lyase system protein PhnG [Burkholderia pseudomallei MSHR146]AJX76177.1 phosphonate C-P lyase system protein PhnG [Burkholderia pseudomallei MSHR2543]KGC77655.1 phosphonate C-P lyase system protein PhnG [Burkholderia pseu
MSASAVSSLHAARRDWLAVLAKIPRDELERALDRVLDGAPAPAFDWLRAPEIGLAMVRGRIGGTGDPFNLGEASVTRAALRLRGDRTNGTNGTTGADGMNGANGANRPHGATVGIAYVLGRDKRRAELVALADALLQTPERHERLRAALIEPFRARLAQARAARSGEIATTRVEFFTMVRGE